MQGERERAGIMALHFSRWTTGRLLSIAILLFVLLVAGIHVASYVYLPKPIAGVEAETLAWEGGEISYIRAGNPEGWPVVFAHGTPGQAETWAQIITAPPDDLDCWFVSRPGFGASTPRDAVTALGRQALALKPVLEAAGESGRKPVVLGHSTGGSVVCRLAADYPDLIGAAVLAAGALDPALEELHWFNYFGDLPGVRLLLPRPWRNCNHERLHLKAELEKLKPRLAEITTPVIIVHGTADALVSYGNVHFLEEHLPGGSLRNVITLRGVNHFLHKNSVDVLLQAARNARDLLRAAPEPEESAAPVVETAPERSETAEKAEAPAEAETPETAEPAETTPAPAEKAEPEPGSKSQTEPDPAEKAEPEPEKKPEPEPASEPVPQPVPTPAGEAAQEKRGLAQAK
jgi:pimeloyl-ACP methyl ester carboxylesterase